MKLACNLSVAILFAVAISLALCLSAMGMCVSYLVQIAGFSESTGSVASGCFIAAMAYWIYVPYGRTWTWLLETLKRKLYRVVRASLI